MARVSQIAEHNTNATEQLAASSDKVMQVMLQVSAVFEENSAAAEQVSASAEEVSVQMEESGHAMAQLSELSKRLLQMIDQFDLQEDHQPPAGSLNGGNQQRDNVNQEMPTSSHARPEPALPAIASSSTLPFTAT